MDCLWEFWTFKIYSIWVSSYWNLSVSTRIIIQHSILIEIFGRMVPVTKVVLLWYDYWQTSYGERVQFLLFLWFNFNGFLYVKEKEQSSYVTVVPSPHTQTVEDIQFHYCHGF